MPDAEPSRRRYLRTALFLDFDNTFIALEREQRDAAESFGASPQRWVNWLERELDTAYAGHGTVERRRILLRRCYLNPRAFHLYRPHFIRSGFEVVDCPPLTQQGKTSADLLMAMDVIDALSHPTHFDEFLIFSGDADFTPVLLRLRKHDRRTAVLAVGPSSPAYRSAGDLMISTEEFVEQGLGIADLGQGAEPAPRSPSPEHRELLARIAARVAEHLNLVGRVEAAQLPALYKEFRDFTEREDWLGYQSLRAMSEAVVAASDRLEIVEEDPWWVGRSEAGEEPEETAAEPEAAAADADVEGEPAAAPPDDEEVAAFVRECVGDSGEPVPLATVAHALIRRFGDPLRLTDWRGTGSFSAYLEELAIEPVRLSRAIPGLLWDPARHDQPASEEDDELAERHPRLAQLAHRINDLTDMPYLSPETYGILLREIAKEVNAHGYHLTRTSKAVRDALSGKGVAIARAQVTFVLRGINFAGHPLGRGAEESPEVLAEVLAENVVNLCRRAQLELDEEERAMVAEWVTSEVGGQAAIPPAAGREDGAGPEEAEAEAPAGDPDDGDRPADRVPEGPAAEAGGTEEGGEERERPSAASPAEPAP